MAIDLSQSPAKLLLEPSKGARSPTTAVDIVQTVYDPAARSFMCLVRRRVDGQLATVPAHHLVIGTFNADLGV